MTGYLILLLVPCLLIPARCPRAHNIDVSADNMLGNLSLLLDLKVLLSDAVDCGTTAQHMCRSTHVALSFHSNPVPFHSCSIPFHSCSIPLHSIPFWSYTHTHNPPRHTLLNYSCLVAVFSSIERPRKRNAAGRGDNETGNGSRRYVDRVQCATTSCTHRVETPCDAGDTVPAFRSRIALKGSQCVAPRECEGAAWQW